MNRPLHPLLFSLQKVIIDLALTDRNHYLVDKDRRENDIEHSFTVAVLCWFIHSHYKINLDLGKVFKYAIVHDFVEVYAGDTNAFASTKERKDKLEREKEALQKLSQEFADFTDMVEAMKNYEAKADDEALFVWTVDKMQALILGDLDGWRNYKELGIDYNSFSNKYHDLLAKCSPYSKEIFETLVEYCKSTYYDRPKSRPHIR